MAVVGLKREARIAAGPGVVVIAGGAAGALLQEAVHRALAAGARAVVSIGLAGALDPALKPGDLVVGTEVAAEGLRFAADAGWAERLLAGLPEARLGRVAGAAAPLADAAAKARLRRETGADGVDMESGAAARAAAAAGVPLAVLRAVSDGAGRNLPRAALAGFAADGGMDVIAVVRALLWRPFELPARVRTGIEAEAGFRALRRGRRRLGPSLGAAPRSEQPHQHQDQAAGGGGVDEGPQPG